MSPRGEIASPCISICQIDRATNTCSGCRRTLREIGTWLQYTDEERRRIMDELPNRCAIPLTAPGRNDGSTGSHF